MRNYPPNQRKRDPFVQVRQRAMRNAAMRAADFCDDYIMRGDSPIEKILFAALLSEIELGSHEIGRILTAARGERFNHDLVQYVAAADRHYKDDTIAYRSCIPLCVENQVDLLGCRVDFLVYVPHGPSGPKSWKYLVVECDGHDYHERTKADAARDRSRDRKFQEKGYTVFRFTGSEIWRNPCKCADQIVDWAVNQVCG